MTDRTPISTPDAPAAIGPYSQAIAAGGLVFCSGQIALDPATGELVGDDAPAQAAQCLRNLAAVLEAAGSSPSRVVRCTVYLADLSDFAAVNAVYAETFGGDAPPSRATVQAGLPMGAFVEIDCIALAPQGAALTRAPHPG